MREDRALINWTFRGYSTGQVTATPVWLSNSVLTWLAQLARILCGPSFHPCLVNTSAGGGKEVDRQTSFSSFSFLHLDVSTQKERSSIRMKKKRPSGITMSWSTNKEEGKLFNYLY